MRLSTARDQFISERRIGTPGHKALSPTTLVRYYHSLTSFIDWLLVNHSERRRSADSVRCFTSEHAQEYIAHRSARDRSPSTMHVDCAALREFARWGAKKRYWTPAAVDEMPEVVRPEALPRPMTSTQRDRVMTLDLEPAEAALRALLYYTGAREFELLALRLSDLAAPHRLPDNTEAPGFVRLWGKGRRERIVEMHPDLWRALEAHLAQARGQHTDHFVLSLTAQPWSKSMVINRVKRWGADADVPTLTPHVFRHCFATDTLEATNDLLAVQQLLGHRRPETTQIYTKVVDRRRNAAVRSLPSFSTPALPGGDP